MRSHEAFQVGPQGRLRVSSNNSRPEFRPTLRLADCTSSPSSGAGLASLTESAVQASER